MNKNSWRGVVAVGALLASGLAAAATDWSTQDYDLYPGDFDADGRTDLLYVAKDPARASGIARSDGNGPNIPFQSWASNYLGIPWSGNQYVVLVADFNSDQKADVLMQRATAGDSYLLFADANGKITAITQTIANSAMGLLWSADKSKLIAGDFSGDGKADLFLQATTPAGTQAVVLANASGQFTGSAAQTWTESSWSAFKWSTRHSNVFVGDFNGDGKKDLLIQARPKLVMIDFDVQIPIPTYPPNMNGVVISQGGATPFQQVGVQQWSRTAHGVDWSPLSANVIVGDFDGNGRADVLLQARSGSRPSYLLSGNAAGAAFTSGTALATNVTWAGNAYRLLATNFDGSSAVGIYFQAVSSDGINSYAATITGGSVTQTSDVALHPVAAIGRTAGAPSVSQTGNAQYDIPIWTPPGAGGMRPTLALGYNHLRENGILGMGFGVSGFSAITRCPKTGAQDGAPGPIKLDSTDALCLDGMRLRPDPTSPSGSGYRTEIESFALITPQESTSTGPGWFEVRHPNGLIYEYGHSTDSKIEAYSSAAVREWALSSIRDRGNNVVEFKYVEDVTNGSYRPDEINYAKHAPSPTISVAPYQVKFVYDPVARPDPIYEQQRPFGPMNELARLARIEVRYTGAVKKLYAFSYETTGPSGRSRLKTLQECAASTNNCLAPTQFSWTGTTPSLQSLQSVTSATAVGLHIIDVNGDSRDDLVYVSSATSGSGTWRIRLANTSGGFDAEIDTTRTNTNYTSALPLEWDGDGRMDLLVPYSGGTWWVLRSNGAGFDTPFNTTYTATGAGYYTRTFDINGDGIDELLRASSSGPAILYVRYRAGSNFGAEQMLWAAGDPNLKFYGDILPPLQPVDSRYLTSRRRADFDGDGREDFIGWLSFFDPETQTTSFWAAPFYAGEPAGAFDGGPEVGGQYTLGDLNDDHLTDVMWIKSDNNLRILYGGSTIPIVGPNTAGYASNPFLIADYDGDGRNDVLMRRASDNVVVYFRSTGIGLAAPQVTTLTLPSALPMRVGDLNADGYSDIIALNTTLSYSMHSSETPDLLSQAIDGFGVKGAFTYAAGGDPSVYTRDTSATPAQEINVTMARPIVKKATLTDGTGAGTEFDLNISYFGARRHINGRGFLGFAKRTIVDGRPDYNLTTEETYLQSWPYTGLPSGVTLKQSNGNVLRQTTNSWNEIGYGTGFNVRKHPYMYSSTSTLREINNTHYATVTTALAGTLGVNGIDSTSGLVVDATTTTTEFSTGLHSTQSKSERVYHSSVLNDISANWCVGRPTATQLINSHTLPGGAQDDRVRSITWNQAGCRPMQVVTGPSGLTVTTDFTYDGFGNASVVTVTGASMTPRTTTLSYGTAGQFPETITNALSQQMSQGFRYDLGVQTSVTDLNGLVTGFEYDDFGRRVRETRPDQTRTHWTYLPCSGCNSRVKYFASEQTQAASGAAIQTNQFYLDQFDRVLYDYQQLANGAYSLTNQDFDVCGRALRRYNPHWSASEGYWQFEYDVLDRVKKGKLYTAGGSLDREVSLTYNGLATTATDAASHATTQYVTAWGDLTRVTDASGDTNYQFDAFGLLKEVKDASNNTVTSIGYNDRGMKTSMTDADMGSGWTYLPNALGEVEKFRDPRTTAPAWTTELTYDPLGRVFTRKDVAENITSTFTFGTALTSSPSSKNVGKLISLTTSNTSYTQNLTYDTFARPITEQITTDTSYQYDYTYDAQTGLPSTMTYPVSTSGYRFKLQYDYAYGQIARVKRFDSPNTEYWKFNTIDARGNVLTEDLGNGVKVTSGFNPLTGLLESRQSGPGGGTAIQNLTYQWSNNGNLTRRQDLRQSLTEVFTYDSLERLDVTTLNSTPTQDVDYSAIGNIMKMDAGASNWTYDATRKHAVTVAGSSTFAYDADGNMQTRTGSAVTWFSYNLPNKIDGSGGVSSQFTYDPLRARVKQVATYTTGTETTHYIGGLMEKVVTASNTQYRHYIATPTGLVGVYTRRTSGALEDTFYFTKDHLGSIDSITNASGAIQVRLSYDTFGKRRKEAGWSGTVPAADWTAIENTTRRGYTGHEHLDNLGLIHMNGRVQDPTIGRFLSADPFVPNPLSGQSFNRYSYAANNPLSFIDPSGFTETQPDDPNNDPNEGSPWFGIYIDFSWIFTQSLDARRLISPSNPFAGPAGGGPALGPDHLETRSGDGGHPCADRLNACMSQCRDEARVWTGGLSQAAGGAVSGAILSRGRWQGPVIGAIAGGTVGSLQAQFPDNKVVQALVAGAGAVIGYRMQASRFAPDLAGAVTGQALGEAIGIGSNGGATAGGVVGVLMAQLQGTLRSGLSTSAVGRRNMLLPRLGSMNLLALASGFVGGAVTDLSAIELEEMAESRCRDKCSGR